MEQPDQTPELPNRQTPFSSAFRDFITQGWGDYPPPPAPLPAAAWTAPRRRRLLEQFPGDCLIVPAGPYRVRANDTDYRYRPQTAFAHLSGLGQDLEPDAVLVIGPATADPDDDQIADAAVLYFHPRAPRTDPEFYSSGRYGEMWVGARPSIDEMATLTGLTVRSIEQLTADLASLSGHRLRVIREADPRTTNLVDVLRDGPDSDTDSVDERRGWDRELAVAVSELRLTKDDFEIGQLEQACAATKVGFEAVIRELPEAVRRGRGERWVEGVFGLHARHLGNAVGYDTIAAGGDHANTLHWIRNDGDLHDGDLLLLDAGVEVDTLYTADVTRTLPVNGRFSPAQREVYEAVLAAQQAGIEAARPGAPFIAIHQAAVAVLTQYLADWGCLPVSVEEALSDQGGQWRRWMVHGTSHHLGLDVHDCAQARREEYRQGPLRVGMTVTVEPGLYFKATDELAPERFRGIGVRIEDDILITEDGCRLLSADFPRGADAVETWIAQVQGNAQ
ncbi:MAG: aminopeptidase P family protein [Propionibacteriaceae bacterium]|jgi:Xaa-Pro aminopeptidase|nr:aminopeptidase P family protein [Propionibacteriaceae bacterium]